ncbi:unnamed protein product [Musa acuminata subsp. malaccensis]|uniref:Glycosyltransferase n=1 Tax=Musa acuminata subsp. malaccensis TaxID=214687 RepID=A0A804L871_MUSAM|nr:PREDICTED: UDP-glycosyltransferase 82A1 [Musa acuminata subsp. malaccensis]CAG1864678.1 unnamed protein product [Musa acuminata subsp. malaccensis]
MWYCRHLQGTNRVSNAAPAIINESERNGEEGNRSEEWGMRPRVVLVPFPAQGHVSPMLDLARVLHARGFEVTVAAPDFIHRRLAGRADDGIRFASVSSGLMADDGAAPPDFAAIERAMESHMPAHLERLLSPPDAEAIACVVVDLVASWAIPVARRCGLPVAGFWTAMLATYRVISAIPELIRRGFISEFGSPLSHQPRCQHDGQEQAAQELTLEGQAKLSASDLPWLVGNPTSQRSRFAFWLRVIERAKSVRWLLVNSFPEEGGRRGDHHPPLPSSQPQEHDAPRTLPVGPLEAHGGDEKTRGNSRCNLSMWDEDQSCLEWLEKHPPNSVVYASFGSWVAPISPEKIAEFALGLEAAAQPFLWVLKDEKPWRAGLPRGFLDRVAGYGKVVAWAPQEEVLRSPAIGCYLTHCGWNSTLEAIRHEKRLLCYPIAGDQFVNAVYIVKVWGIGIKLDGCHRHAIENGIGRIMTGDEGAKAQASVLQLKKRVMGEEGSSAAVASLQCFIDTIKKSM